MADPDPAVPAPADPAPAPVVDPPKAQGDPAPGAEDIAKLQQALERERSLRRDAERAAKEGAGFKAKVDEIEAASRSDLEKAVDAARKEGAAEALTTANGRLIASEARALAAAAAFRDAGDAVHFLDLSDVAVTADGVVDATAITKQLEQLAKDKPYLLVEQVAPVPTPAQAGIGVGGNGSQVVAPGMDRLRAAYSASPHKLSK